ncbi:protein PAT1 homolog [Gossypium hirsutum]|uniref:Protein PAT1 homolog n=1 Tax=Gossypium hirsutum TaxID=3635 RepID=A0ABM3B6Z9_GOSHI|nr:protein PAT1 homolog [Gossypium hirsutum]
MDASEDLKQFGDTDKGGAVFDASQYAFFGNDVLEEVELGGLDDEDEDLPAAGLDEEEFLFDQEEITTSRGLCHLLDNQVFKNLFTHHAEVLDKILFVVAARCMILPHFLCGGSSLSPFLVFLVVESWRQLYSVMAGLL